MLVLTDFGDARHIENEFNVLPLMGSPEFCAPEIVSSSPVGLATDIWCVHAIGHYGCCVFIVDFLSRRSVGVVTYVLLSGVSPFLDESPEETCAHILHNDFSYPAEYFDGISAEAKDFTTHTVILDMR